MSMTIFVGVALALASLLQANLGSAEDSPPFHKGLWPIRNGRNHQPTEHELEGAQVIPPMAAPFQPQSVASLIDEGADHVHSDRLIA